MMNTLAESAPASLHVGNASVIQNIPLENIRILNPRVRNKQVFARLVENISTVGLKRPITVTSDGEKFDLVCGQGRFEAFQALGETEIPCVIVSAVDADRYLISLVENLARRKHSNKDLLAAIGSLSERGYSPKDIAKKTGLNQGYIACILILLTQGEERLIAAVEKGWLPLSIATEVAKSDDALTQKVMLEAYETGLLRGDQLIKVRRLIDVRRSQGKNYVRNRQKSERMTSPGQLLKTYQQEVNRQSLIMKKADINQQRLLFVVSALRKLLALDEFQEILRSEGLTDMPEVLANRVYGESTL